MKWIFRLCFLILLSQTEGLSQSNDRLKQPNEKEGFLSKLKFQDFSKRGLNYKVLKGIQLKVDSLKYDSTSQILAAPAHFFKAFHYSAIVKLRMKVYRGGLGNVYTLVKKELRFKLTVYEDPEKIAYKMMKDSICNNIYNKSYERVRKGVFLTKWEPIICNMTEPGKEKIELYGMQKCVIIESAFDKNYNVDWPESFIMYPPVCGFRYASRLRKIKLTNFYDIGSHRQKVCE